MGLDIYFRKKDIVDIDEYANTRDRELFDYITTKCGVKYGSEEYGEDVRLNKRQVNKIIKYMSRKEYYGRYDKIISEMIRLKEENGEIYMCADW